MKILVTGGAGFIGSNIVKEGLIRGHEITVLDNLSTGYTENLAGLDVNFVNGDVLDSALLTKVTKGLDGIFHLAASVGNVRSIENPFLDVQINYGGTLNVLETMRKNSISSLIYSSTAAGYGEPVKLPINEEHPFNPDSPYGVTKIAAEKLAFCYGRNFGFRVAALRYFNAYGVNQRYDAYGNVIPIFARKHLQGESLTVYGDGNQTRDFINVRDIARANWLALENRVSGYFNVATGVRTSVNSLIEAFQSVSGTRPSTNYASPRKGEVKHSVADINKVKNSLGFEPEVSLLQGLTEYWNWYKEISLHASGRPA